MSATLAGLRLFAVLVALPLLARSRGGVLASGRGGRAPREPGGLGLPARGVAGVPGERARVAARGVRASGGGCLLGLDHGQRQLLGYVPGTLVLGVLALHGLR